MLARSVCLRFASVIYMHFLVSLIKRWCITISVFADQRGISTIEHMTLRQLSRFPVASFDQDLLPIGCAINAGQNGEHRGKDAGRRHRAGGGQICRLHIKKSQHPLKTYYENVCYV